MRIDIGTPDNFDELLKEPTDDLVVVYFWGPNCPNCEIFARDLPQLLQEMPEEGMRLIKVNAYEHTQIAQRFGLFGIPAFVLFRNGRKLGMMRQYYGRDYWKSVLLEQRAAAMKFVTSFDE